jgi:hypothetical protein
MTARAIALSGLLLAGWLATPVSAQQAAPAAPASDIDVTKLPLNMVRLQMKLQAAVAREEATGGPRIHYNIDVLGSLPRLKLFSPEDNLRDGPVPYGIPTHRDMMNYATPKEFSAPAADFNSLLRWIRSKTAN